MLTSLHVNGTLYVLLFTIFRFPLTFPQCGIMITALSRAYITQYLARKRNVTIAPLAQTSFIPNKPLFFPVV